ncbi:MAG: hypothetical protein F4Z66_07035 [Gammaproteobacteria bacterium]|nr:hypothetical protein [Gammaproteobacteria bacterium]
MRQLYEEKKDEFTKLLKTEQAVPLLDFLFEIPTFYSPWVHQKLGIKRERAAGYLRILLEKEVLTQIVPASGRKGAILSFSSLLSIADQQ